MYEKAESLDVAIRSLLAGVNNRFLITWPHEEKSHYRVAVRNSGDFIIIEICIHDIAILRGSIMHVPDESEEAIMKLLMESLEKSVTVRNELYHTNSSLTCPRMEILIPSIPN